MADKKEYIERGEAILAVTRDGCTANVVGVLFHMPAADVVEVRHGEWKKTCVPDVFQCTSCKRPTKMDELCDSETLRAYCPNCGARMDGERKEQT